jgi:hypothetical protein
MPIQGTSYPIDELSANAPPPAAASSQMLR